MRSKFEILPLDEIRIIKKINIVSRNRFGNDIVIGYFYYERSLEEEYRFLDDKSENNDPLYLLRSYPTQESFPIDKIDQIILSSVKDSYPESYVHNELIFSTSDVERLENSIKRPSEDSTIIISPDFSGEDLHKLSGREFESCSINIKIFVEGSSELIKQLLFYGFCDLDSMDEVYNTFEEVNFL